MTTGATGVRREGEEPAPGREHNVAGPERVASALAGLGAALWGIRRGGFAGLTSAALGGALLERALTGHSRLYAALGTGTAHDTRSPVASVPHNQGIKVERAVTVARPARELYDFWRDFRNLPRVMEHLEGVEPLPGGRSRWVARSPLGGHVVWEAEIWNERPGELIAWRSLEGADVDNAGSVQFRELPAGRGTEVRVVLEYRPPLGKVGAAVARLLGENPDQQVREDLRRFKQLMEAGESATTQGQPSGREEPRPRPARARAEPEFTGGAPRPSTSGARRGDAGAPQSSAPDASRTGTRPPSESTGPAGEFPLDPSIFGPAEGRAGRGRNAADLVDEASQESFPASDPPGWAPGEEEAGSEPPRDRSGRGLCGEEGRS